MLRRVFRFLLCMTFALSVTVAPAAVAEPSKSESPAVNVKYIHDAILAKWNVSVGYNSALTNKSVAANMKYLMAAIDIANKKIGGSSKVYSGTSYATSYAVNKRTVDNAIKNLIKKPRTFPFTATTTSDTTKFSFTISATGEFWVDWGDGTAVETITKTDTTNQTISHTYTTAGVYAVRIGGRATGYASSYNESSAAISFKNNKNLAKISGSLGEIFPTVNGRRPIFHSTFYGCTNLTGSIPEKLFSGISGAPAVYMFASTFRGSSGLTGSIPSGLFGNISGAPAAYMFDGTFNGCTGLTGEIPSGLFGELSGAPAPSMFGGTFRGCSGLTGSIPSGLFGNITGAPATYMFDATFNGCSGLTGEIPAGLFGELSGAPAYSMFGGTFRGCSGLTGEIPLGLFGNLSGTLQNNMFTHTFNGCSGLTGKSARSPDGTYLYNAFASATSTQVGDMYTGTCLEDNASIPSTWGGKACTYVEPEPEYPFELTVQSYGKYQFDISAAGTFYVNWGDGSAFQKIEKTDTTRQTISHTYAKNGAYTVKLGGRATKYSTGTTTAAISFKEDIDHDYYMLKGISGSLGAIFSTLSDGSQPRFYNTFSWCTGMTGEIPENLFAGIHGAPVSNMFSGTFGNSGFNSIPAGLFAEIHGAPAEGMFSGTFARSGITGIPANLFAGISGAPAEGMFNCTFCGSQITEIPAGLFAGISGTPAKSMFFSTFGNCNRLTGEIPSGLFGNLSGAPAAYMFQSTFDNCTGLTGEIPLGLFGNLSGAPASSMFYRAFYNCGGLTGKSARNPDGTYLYDVFPTATSSQVGDMYTGTCMDDNANITSTWGDNFVCISSGSIPSDKLSFTATTTSDTTSFSFDISAAGTFYVDWGDGTAGETITKTGTITKSISHTYAAAASYDIKIGGLATAYQTSGYTGAISFSSNKKLAGISGSLGAIFPTLSDGSQPRFSYTFNNCTNLKGSIPENLFAGVSGAPIKSMFENAFDNCKGLTGNIPENLFAGISGAPTENLFKETFYNCSGLTGGIPENLFAGIKGAPANDMFSYTFSGCSGLTGDIPVNLFAGISGAPAEGMFNYTFNGCTGLTGIAGRLFAGIKGVPADYMFQGTFNNCTGLTGEIPLGLFGNLSGAPAFHMFQNTFNGCSGLTGKSARNPDGTYLYNAFSSATSSQVDSMYSGTCLYDNASIPRQWGGATCTYTGPIPSDGEVTDSTFTITTTSDTSSFAIIISAAGKFYVDWGDGGIIETITKTDTDEKYITHDYGYYNQDTYTIKISGKATAYSDGYAAIRFDYDEHTEKISGSLGAIFPTLADGSQPNFDQTFYNHTKLTSLPEGLFTGIKGAPTDGMFHGTFAGCENLTGEIPLGFFGDLSGKPADYMFVDTFSGCSGLTGPSARNPDGTYLYNVFPSATSDNVGGMYTDATELSDYNDIPDDWK